MCPSGYTDGIHSGLSPGSYLPPVRNANRSSPLSSPRSRPLNKVRQQRVDSKYVRSLGLSTSTFTGLSLSTAGFQLSASSHGRSPLSAQGYLSRNPYALGGRSSLASAYDYDGFSTSGLSYNEYSDTITGSGYGDGSYGRLSSAYSGSPTITGNSYVGASPRKRSTSRAGPSAGSLTKYPSDCPDCAGHDTYCFACSPVPGKLTIRPEFKTEAVGTHRPGTLTRQPAPLNASPHLDPVRIGDRRQSESSYGCAKSFNGTPIWCILDTGAANTNISPSFLRLAFPGIRQFRDQSLQMMGVGGGIVGSKARVDLKMIWTGTNGRQVLTNGEAWVAEPGTIEQLNCDVLLGLPYMRDNGMDLRWSGVQRRESRSLLPQILGDRLEIKGVTIEICITR